MLHCTGVEIGLEKSSIRSSRRLIADLFSVTAAMPWLGAPISVVSVLLAFSTLPTECSIRRMGLMLGALKRLSSSSVEELLSVMLTLVKLLSSLMLPLIELLSCDVGEILTELFVCGSTFFRLKGELF